MKFGSGLLFRAAFFTLFLVVLICTGCQKDADNTLPDRTDSLPDRESHPISKVMVYKIGQNNFVFNKTGYTIDAASNGDSVVAYAADTIDHQNACYSVTLTKVAHYYENGLLTGVKSRAKTKVDCGLNPAPGPFNPTFGNHDIDIQYHPQYKYPSSITFTRFHDTAGKVVGAEKIYLLTGGGPFQPNTSGFQLYSDAANIMVDYQKVTADTLFSFEFGINPFYDWLQMYNKQNAYESFDVNYYFFNYNGQKQIKSFVGVNLWDSAYYSVINGVPSGGEYRPQLERKIDLQYNSAFDSVAKLLGLMDFHQYAPYMRLFDDEWGYMTPREARPIDQLIQLSYSATDSLLYVRHGKRDLIGTVRYNSTSTRDAKGRLKTVLKTNSRISTITKYEIFYAD